MEPAPKVRLLKWDNKGNFYEINKEGYEPPTFTEWEMNNEKPEVYNTEPITFGKAKEPWGEIDGFAIEFPNGERFEDELDETIEVYGPTAIGAWTVMMQPGDLRLEVF